MKKKIWLLAAAAVLMLGPAASAQTMSGTWAQPLEGRRFETMRALAHYLDAAAQDARAGAVRARRRGTAAERRAIAAVRDFASRAESFHTRMDDYELSHFELPDEVDDLTVRARRVSGVVREDSAYQNTYDDWDNVMDALDRMRRLLNGEDVDIPDARDEYGDYERDYGYLRRGTGEDDQAAALSDTQLQQLRDLARDLERQAESALQTADRSTSRYGRASGILNDLRGFVDSARDLSLRTDRGDLTAQEATALVDGLTQNARELERRMRDARAFADAWAAWTRVIETLDRMGSLVR
jgi:hypothetical protein